MMAPVVSTVVSSVVEMGRSFVDSSPVVGPVAFDVRVRIAGVERAEAVGFFVVDGVLLVVAPAFVHPAAPEQPQWRTTLPQKVSLNNTYHLILSKLIMMSHKKI